MEDSLVEATRVMEKATRTRFSEDLLVATVQQVNEIKVLVKEFLQDHGASDLIPADPRTFARLLWLLDMTLVDMNSRPGAFKVNLAGMLAEMERRVAGGAGFDASDLPPLLCTPWAHDMDPRVLDVAETCGARVIVASWELLGYLEPVTPRNPLASLARHLIEARALARSPEDMADRTIRIARDLGVAGIITHQSCPGHHGSDWTELLETRGYSRGMAVLEVPARGDGARITTLHDNMKAFVHGIQMA